jgi:hypothetical protein
MNTVEPTPQPSPTRSSCCGEKAKSLALWALVALNVVLVLVLVGRYTPQNRAQAAGGRINPSDVLAVPGSLPGFPNGVVFLVDNNSGLLTAMSYDSPTNSVTWLRAPIDIARLANAAGGNRR